MSESNSLPKSIEAATGRYLHHYETNFKGPKVEMKRLKMVAEASIFHLRRKAPNFYEHNLHNLVNQAASALLACDTETAQGSIKFHETHRNFLKVLDELKKTQPDGEISFQDEVERVVEKDTLLKKHLALRRRIDELEAEEIDCDEMGSESADAKYNALFNELDNKKMELKKISKLIAKLEGVDVDVSEEFKLLIFEGSTLERLSTTQRKSLESQIREYLKQNKNKKKSMYVDKSIIDGMIAKLNITHLTQVELNDLAKDALDAYKQHYRDIENEIRNEFYDCLLKNTHLTPKEGLILASPEDIPDDVKNRLDQSDRRLKRKLDECIEEFARRQPEMIDENASADAIEDEDDSSNDGVEFEKIIEDHKHLFKRVKEEPRDDYDNEAPSDEEVILPTSEADQIEIVQQSVNGRLNSNEYASSSYSTPERNRSSSPTTCDNEQQLVTTSANLNDQSQGEFEVLGLVVPADKIPLIEIDD